MVDVDGKSKLISTKHLKNKLHRWGISRLAAVTPHKVTKTIGVKEKKEDGTHMYLICEECGERVSVVCSWDDDNPNIAHKSWKEHTNKDLNP